MITRRSLLRFTAAGIGVSAVGTVFSAAAADTTPLVDRAVATCRRLAPSGWRQLLLDVTSGELDLTLRTFAPLPGRGMSRTSRR